MEVKCTLHLSMSFQHATLMGYIVSPCTIHLANDFSTTIDLFANVKSAICLLVLITTNFPGAENSSKFIQIFEK
ncbi:hypothetical protein BHM03_00044631 [Ensete ventricosum]|nr:hypothetical protein BHM03_00044631 [Ensete ventricosum]